MGAVARVDLRPSITGIKKRWCHESLSQRDLMNLLERKTYLSDSREMDEALCAKDLTRLRSWIFPTHFMTYLERGSKKQLEKYRSRVPGECLTFENIR